MDYKKPIGTQALNFYRDLWNNEKTLSQTLKKSNTHSMMFTQSKFTVKCIADFLNVES